jgi:A/G-specific adenine glycosylase
MLASDVRASRAALLEWYRPRRRAYPWRRRPTPYRVLVSEVMLQQTQAGRVAPAFDRFVRRFPTIMSLAAAPPAEVLRAWSGLGYNRRAVSLSNAARIVALDHRGRVPSDPPVLAVLPGIGPYTAAAIASMAFGRAVPALDTNVRRVVARAVLGVEPASAPSAVAASAAAEWIDPDDPGAWNQAVMDLGREVCRPRPRCEACPVRPWCAGRRRVRVAAPAGSRGRPAQPFEGSMRQIRGSVVRTLRARPSATVGMLAGEAGCSRVRLVEAVRALHADGVVRAGPGALRGDAAGRVRLPD